MPSKTFVSGREAPGEFALPIVYSVDLREIDHILLLSKNCRQLIKWQCFSAAINNPYTANLQITFWTSG